MRDVSHTKLYISMVVIFLLLFNSFVVLSPRSKGATRNEGSVTKLVDNDGNRSYTEQDPLRDKESAAATIHQVENTAITRINSLCSRKQIQNGQWHKIRLDKPPYVPPNISKFLCMPIDAYQQDYFDTYEWKPLGECEFLPFNATQFCSLLVNQSVLFMGDSLTQESMFSLGELLQLKTSPSDSLEMPIYNFSSACRNTVSLSFRRDDFLNPTKVAWELHDKQPSVAVLNRGAHYVNDDTLLQDMNETVQHVSNWQEDCRQRNQQCLLVWRTSVPGHPNCASFHAPSTNRTLMEHLIQTSRQAKKYHWNDFDRQNQLIEAILQQSNVEYEMLDAYDVNILRPDNHRASLKDCLHSCMGSKLDVYAQLLLHILQRKRANANGVANDGGA
ncbi:hypothetical protein MPSEU_000261600 [Mayamaea pseudoterrestris]|nr:hypothetical protein MPSEU_000261600 [Mayamaea pseudoterrestris]